MITTRFVRVLRSAAAAALLQAAPAAFAQSGNEHAVVMHTFHHDTLPSLRDAAVPASGYGHRTHFEGKLPPLRGTPNLLDGAWQKSAAKSVFAPTFQTGVDGISDGFVGPAGTFNVNSAPPDTVGAIGATQYVQVVNTGLAVFDKATKNAVYGPVPTNTLWAGFTGACETDNDGDAVVNYDKAADRWVVSQFAVSSGNFECIAVSQSNDATGAWNRYAFDYGTDFPDYPKVGVWPDGYYVTFNMFTSTFIGAKLCAYDRASMLAGAAAAQQCFQLSNAYGGVLPSDLDGSTAPPAGSPNYMVALDTTTSLALWKFHVDWTTPANTTLSPAPNSPISIPVSAFSPACSGGNCIKQPAAPGGAARLDSLADRLMFRLAYRNFGDHEALVVNHSVTAGSLAGVRWYELRGLATTPVVYQEQTFAPDTTENRWMGSIAMDQSGNMALGYSVSSTATYPSIRYTGRLALDPLNTMQAEDSIIAGTGSQTGGLNRWGDYSAMTVDPTDDCTFWFTSEYIKTSGSFNWHTRIASFKFPTCGVATYSIGGNISGLVGSVGLQLDGTNPTSTQTQTFSTSPFTFSTTLPAGSDWTVSVATQPTGQNCVVTNGSGSNLSANVGTVQVTCTPIQFTVTASAPGGNGTITPPTQQVDSGSAASFTVTPAANYHVASVTGDNCTVTQQGVTTTWVSDAITQNCAVTAQFAIDTFTLTYTAGANGTISGTTPQTVNFGASGSPVTAQPNLNYHFVKWSDNSTANPRTDTNVQANISVTASFAIDTHTVMPSVTGSGSITPNTPQTVNYNTTKSFTLAAVAGNHIVNVTGTCGGTLTGNTFTTAPVTADCNVIANFAANPPVLVFTIQPANLNQGDMLGTVQVTEKDSITGNTISDSASVDFTIVGCGGMIDLGSVPMSNGVATLSSTQRFYTAATGLTISAATSTLSKASNAFNVAAGNVVFSNGFEICRL